MGEFSALERAAIAAILDEIGEQRAIIEQHMLHVNVRSSKNTGGGFFTELEIDAGALSLDPKTAPLGQNVWISVDGLEFGLGMILHLKDGRADLLEGYAVGPEDTSRIDFERVRYAIAAEPGPLPPNGS